VSLFFLFGTKKDIMKANQESALPLFVSGLSKIYPAENKHGQSFTAVNDISFSLKKGQILGLLGPNGAGKSTTISMLLGSLTPTTGEIKFFGQDLATHSSAVMQDVAFASTYIRMPWRLTIMENLRIYGLLYGVKGQVFERRV
jgi:ABC-2 type transport system ATP-binding protein